MSLAYLEQLVADLDRQGLLRRPRRIEGATGPRVIVDGREVVLLCSNNYLGLAGAPEIAAGGMAALRDRGSGSGASRLICGQSDLHETVEERLASFVRQEAALLLTSGYHANIGLLPAIAGAGDHILSDELNHASIVDGCRLSRATIHVYPHADADRVARLVRGLPRRSGRVFLVTESVFSMEGDIAPLAELRAICDREDAALIVDEAHALGVMGPSGRGACAAIGVPPDILVGTLGKAFGCAGAFIAGPRVLREALVTRCRPYVFTTAPPPAVIGACLAAVERVEAADDLRSRLGRHVAQMRAALGSLVPAGQSPILPIRIGPPDRTMRISDALLERGFFVQGIRPPTVPQGTSRLRLTLMATHDASDLERAAVAVREIVG